MLFRSLIVRQSSLSAAVNLLLAGAKTPPPVENVLAIAKQFEDYVFGKQPMGSVQDMENDIPQVD